MQVENAGLIPFKGRFRGRLNAIDTGGITIMSEGGCAVRFPEF